MDGRTPLDQAISKQQGGDKVINVGVDVHKKKCVATIKGQSRQILQQITFDSNSDEITRFVDGSTP